MNADGHVQGESLSGKVAVVTGASSGIGLAIAQDLLAAGAEVHGIARRPCPQDGVVSHQVDITDDAAVADVMTRVSEPRGLDALVCAAGLNTPKRRLEELDQELWTTLVNVNLTGVFNCVRSALQPLRRARGSVVMLGSVSGVWPDLSGPAYQAAKVGMLAFARAVAIEEHRAGIRVTVIHPGMTETPMVDARPEHMRPEPAVRAHLMDAHDVAAACLFVLTLPRRAYVPELTILPALLQAQGKTMNVVAPPED